MDWILSKIAALFAPKYVGSVVRTVLGFVSGWIVSLGVPVDQVVQFTNAAEPVFIGVVSALATLAWSLVQKKKNSD